MQKDTRQRGQTFGLKKGFYHDSFVPRDKGTEFSTSQYQGLGGRARDTLIKLQFGRPVSNREISKLRESMFYANGGHLGEEFAKRARGIDFKQHMAERSAYNLERERMQARADAMYGYDDTFDVQRINRDALLAEQKQRELRNRLLDLQGDSEYQRYEQGMLKTPLLRDNKKTEELSNELLREKMKYELKNLPETLENEKALRKINLESAARVNKDSAHKSKIAEEERLKKLAGLKNRAAAGKEWYYQNHSPDSAGYDYFDGIFKAGDNDEFIANAMDALRKQEETNLEWLKREEEKYNAKSVAMARQLYQSIFNRISKDAFNLDANKKLTAEEIADKVAIEMDALPFEFDWRKVIGGGKSIATNTPRTQDASKSQNQDKVQNILNSVKGLSKDEAEKFVRLQLKNGVITQEEALTIAQSVGGGS